jgi:high-affinity K+ transport system ATPase subunit B
MGGKQKNGEIGLVPDQSRALIRAIAAAAMRDSFAKLAPRVQIQNSVTLGVYAGSIVTTLIGVAMSFGGARRSAFVLASDHAALGGPGNFGNEVQFYW